MKDRETLFHVSVWSGIGYSAMISSSMKKFQSLTYFTGDIPELDLCFRITLCAVPRKSNLSSKMTEQERADKSQDVRVSSDSLSSRYEEVDGQEVHGPKGQVAALVQLLESMTLFRLLLQDGDYLTWRI